MDKEAKSELAAAFAVYVQRSCLYCYEDSDYMCKVVEEITETLINRVQEETVREILRILIDVGCAALNDWEKGWDEALDMAYKTVSEKYGVGVGAAWIK